MSVTDRNLFHGFEILIAEDSRTQAEQLRHYLNVRGFSVRVARDGKQALAEALRQAPALVITDVVMPEMNGYELCKEIKSIATLKDVPVVLLTSLSGPQDIVRGLECGADSFIRKPYDEVYLASRVEFILTNVQLRQTSRLQIGVQLHFGGQTHFITAEKQQILDLLISTYEGAIQINEELELKRRELEQAKETLEARVVQRTEELARANRQLEIELVERIRAQEEVKKLNENLELRVVERTTQLAAVNKELEAFSYSVSHDLIAPLRHIDSFAHRIGEGSSRLNLEAQDDLKRIHASVKKMGRMINDLLNLARLDRRSMTLKLTPLDSLVGDILLDFRSETEGRSIDWRVGQLPAVNCDPGLIQQLFVNLLSNAVKYTSRREHAIIEVDHSIVNGELVFFIRDNGAGFNPEYSHKLFGTFQRLHRDDEFEGTGVGLATVQRIVRKHGGRIWAEAETEKGASFFFTLSDVSVPNGGYRHAS